jgi:hypothetical protein
MGTSSSHQSQQQQPRLGPLHLEEKKSTLVPIWALRSGVTGNLIDHSTKATGVSTSLPMPNNQKNYSAKNSSLGNTLRRRMKNSPEDDKKNNNFTNDRGANRNAISQYSGGTKSWIRSGNKWIITNNNANSRLSPGTSPPNEKSGTGSRLFTNRKVDPTAVSSYVTTFKVPAENNAKIRSDNSRRTHARYENTRYAASAISSFASSSAAGLYTRQRLKTTPGGFPYMPALPDMRKKNEGGGGLGISGGTGIARSGGIYSDQQQRFQSSYLLNAKPISSPLSTKTLLQQDDDRLRADDNVDGVDSIFSPYSVNSIGNNNYFGGLPPSTGIQRQSSSGYDSEREERLREWKEQFGPKVTSGDIAAKRTSRRTKSLDSDCDSETNMQKVRTTEWKEEQYRTSAKLKELNGSIGAGSYLRPPIRQTKPGFSYSFAKSNNTHPMASELNQDHRGMNLNTGSSESTDIDFNEHEGYDSDATRRQRLKEWKQQFAHVDVPKRKSTRRLSSTTAEAGALKLDDSQSSNGSAEMLETIQYTNMKKSRRGRAAPGGGFFPITSPQRNNNEHDLSISPGSLQSPLRRQDVINSSASTSRNSLPPLTPPRNVVGTGETLTPKAVNGKSENTKHIEDSSSDSSSCHEESQVVKAAKFLLGLSPTAGDGPVSPTGDCLLSTALDIGSPCKILTSLSVDNTSERLNRVAESGLTDHRDSGQSESLIESDNSFVPIADRSFNAFGSTGKDSSLPSWASWDNCLYVKAEGARSGSIFLAKSHLIFIYEDELSDAVLARYGWNRDQIPTLLHECELSSSRAATPVNVPLDESGQGGGVELIGFDYKKVNVMDLLEDSFGSENIVEEHLNETNLDDQTESYVRQERKKSSFESNLVSRNDARISFEIQKGVNGIKLSSKDREQNSSLSTDDIHRHQYLDDLQPISLSSSSLDSLVDYDQTSRRDSNEDVVSQCIISAINEEAHMRFQEDERTASFSAMDRLDSSHKSASDHDYGTLLGNQTNISSFSEVDMDIDPDQEISLYISGETEIRRKSIGLKWPLSKLAEIFDRKYMMKEVGLEIFAPSSSQSTTASLRQATMESSSNYRDKSIEEVDVPLGPLSPHSIFLVIPEFDAKLNSPFRRKPLTRRDAFVKALKERAANLNDVYWHGSPYQQQKWHWRRSDRTYPLSALTRAWRKGQISNFVYLSRLNAIAGRSRHDPGNYPVMPWVLSNFTSKSVPDLSDERNYRDLSKPMGALCPIRLRKFQEKYASLCASLDTAIPPFMYGSHYSNTGGVVLHYLVRTRPFAGLHRQLQVCDVFY